MAIRIEHQPIGISGLAAYAAGAGRRKERDRKYVTDIIQNQQARADKYNLQADQQRFFIDRDRERAGVDVAADVRRNAFRIGEINLADMKARERDEAATKAMEDRDKTMFDRSEGEDTRNHIRSLLGKPVPVHVPPDLRTKLIEARTAMGKLVTSGFDLSESGTREDARKIVGDYYKTLESIPPPPSQIEMSNKDLAYRDSAGVDYPEDGDGRTPISISTGKPRIEQPEPVEMVTVPGRGKMSVEDAEKLYEQKTKELDRWEKGYSNAVTPEEKTAFEKKNPRPEVPASAIDLLHPPTAQPGGASQGVNPMLGPAIEAARSGHPGAIAALKERGHDPREWETAKPAAASTATVVAPAAAPVAAPAASPASPVGPVPTGTPKTGLGSSLGYRPASGNGSLGVAQLPTVPILPPVEPDADVPFAFPDFRAPGLDAAIDRDKIDLPPVRQTSLQKTVAAAQAGDEAAQKLLDERGIRWRKK